MARKLRAVAAAAAASSRIVLYQRAGGFQRDLNRIQAQELNHTHDDDNDDADDDEEEDDDDDDDDDDAVQCTSETVA